MTEKTKRFTEAMGMISDRFIEDATDYRVQKKNTRLLWASTAAACLCLATVMGVIAMRSVVKDASGKEEADCLDDGLAGYGVDAIGGEQSAIPGGSNDGDMMVMQSIAVYPKTESIKDVARARLDEISETGAYAHELGKYLPDVLPEGYEFLHASMYETTMRDGRLYHMLRVTYATGSAFSNGVAEEDGDIAVQAPVPNADYSELLVFVIDYKPESDRIYTPDQFSESAFKSIGGSTFIIDVGGDVYVGMSVFDLSYEAVSALISDVAGER